MPRKERGNRGRQKQPSRESLNVHQGSVLDVVQEAISCLSRVPRTSEEDASQQRLLEQLQAFCHDVYQDDGLSDALALLIASGHLERILGSEAYSDNTKASVMLLTRSMAMLYKGGPLPVFHWLFRVLALNETRSREQQKFGVLKSLQKIMEPSAAGPVIYEGFIPFVLDNLLTFMSTMRKACFIRTVVGLLEQILILYPLTMETKSNETITCFFVWFFSPHLKPFHMQCLLDFLLKLLKGKEKESMTLARQMIRDIYQELVISVEIKPVFKLSNLEWADFAQNRTQFQVPEDGKRRFRILIALAQELSKIPSEDTKSQLEEIQMKTERLFWIALSRYRDLGWLELGIKSMFYKRKRDSETYKRAVCMGIQLGARMVIKLELLKELLKSFPQAVTTLNLDENESLSVYNWLMRLMLSLQPLPHQERFVKALSCIKTRTLVPSMIQTLENLVQTRETHSHAEVLVSSLRDAFSRNAAEAISSHEFSQLLRIYVQSLDNLGLDIQLDSVIRICCSKFGLFLTDPSRLSEVLALYDRMFLHLLSSSRRDEIVAGVLWIRDFIRSSEKESQGLNLLLEKHIHTVLKRAETTLDPELRKVMMDLCAMYAKMTPVPPKLDGDLLSARIYDSDEAISLASYQLSLVSNPTPRTREIPESLRASLSSGTFLRSFTERHFAIVCSYFGFKSADIAPISDKNSLWLQNLILSCGINALKDMNTVLDSRKNMMKVVLWHSARFCLTNKLRTQLGSATGTVQAFGLALEEHLSLLKSLNPKQEVTELSRHILRMRDLVKFVDLLMDHVVMASEGSHPEPSFHTKSFLNSGSLRALKEMSGLLIRSGKAVGLHRIVQKHGLQMQKESASFTLDSQEFWDVWSSVVYLRNADGLRALNRIANESLQPWFYLQEEQYREASELFLQLLYDTTNPAKRETIHGWLAFCLVKCCDSELKEAYLNPLPHLPTSVIQNWLCDCNSFNWGESLVTYGSTLTLLFYDFSAKAPKLPTENLDVLFKETFRRSQTSSLAKDGETPSGILQNIVERKLSEFEARRHWSSLIAISADSLSPAMSEKLPLDSKAPIKLRVQKLLTEVYPGSAFFWLKSAIVYFEYAYSSVNATESTAGTTTPLTQECGVAFKNALSRGDLNPLHDTTSVSILLKLITTFTDIPCLEPRGAIYSVPIDLWIKLAPQVFALLNSGSIAAVQVAILVIQRMATERLQAILYTLLSESSRMPVGHGRQELEDIISRAKDGPHRGSIEEAQKFLLELNRVSILWDERWCHELTLVSTFLPKTLRRFKGESIKIINMTCLDETGKERMTRETYEILMDPVISSIRKLRDETVRIDSKTPFEKSFQSKYTSGLENMLDSLREPPSPDCVESIYSSVKNVFHQISKLLKETKTLSLSHISPSLLNLKPGSIPLPGNVKDGVMVVRVLNEVEVLPTKNRPKKILIEGSDGEIYPFLVKGFEDLHLDQRVEQFMTVSSEFLCGDSEDPVQCRTYRILPISQNCGLIQWVKGASSLYTVYKSFELAKAQGDDSNATETKILDSYRRKRHEILAKHGLSDSIDRLKVPPHLNVEILRSAQQDTPDNLFARFFGDEFLDAEVYAQKSRNFKRSLALNSILGYVLSLGDRHLENLLIDENTGELIHIDFNVCFDKGKRLKVPEVVPFRLTQSLVSALGVNGIDSEFKSVCESVLQSVRSNWVTLSLLLTEAFVNDPVWDWSNEIATQQESTDRETRVNTNLLKSRIGKRCILLDEIGLPGLLSDTESKRCFISACFEKMELSLDRILREVFTHHSHRQVKATLKDLDKQLKQLELSPASAYREIQDMHGELKTLLGDILSLSFKASLPIKDSWKSLDDCLSQLQKSLSSDSAQAYKSSLIALRDQLLAKNASRTFAPEPSRAVAPEDEEPTDDIEDMGESLIPSQQKEENRVVRDINAPRDTRAYAQYLMKRVEARLRGTAFQGKTITEEVNALIEKATNPDRLAAMYVGWMAWI